MLNNFGLTTAIATILTLTIADAALSQTTPPNSPFPQATKPSQPEQPLCYIQTADGKIVDLQSLCGQSAPVNTNSNDSSQNHPVQTRIRRLRGEL